MLRAGFGLFLLLAGIALLAYFRLVRYEPKVARHVPESATWAVRLSVRSVILFDPFRRHLLAALDDLDPDAQRGRLARFSQASGLNVARDLREIAVAGAGTDWVVAVGGLFPDDGWAEALRQHLLVPERIAHAVDSGRLHGLGRHEISAAQASDGTWLLASSHALLEQALPAGDRGERLGLTVDGDASWGVDQPSTAGPFAVALLGAAAAPGSLRLRGRLTAAESFLISMQIQTGTGGSEKAAAHWNEAAERTLLPRMPAQDWGGERAVLGRSRARAEGAWVSIESQWTRAEVDRAAASAAAWLQRWWRRP